MKRERYNGKGWETGGPEMNRERNNRIGWEKGGREMMRTRNNRKGWDIKGNDRWVGNSGEKMQTIWGRYMDRFKGRKNKKQEAGRRREGRFTENRPNKDCPRP